MSRGRGGVALLVAAGLWAMAAPPTAAAETRCSYSAWRWDTVHRRATPPQRVERPRAALRDDERDRTTGCTVCEQDQRWIEVAGMPPLQVCATLAPRLAQALREAAAAGARPRELIGYRPGFSRGPIDATGLRTVLSNHSFGIALDVDPSHNGLYEGCLRFGPACRLLRGGPWSPDDPRSLRPDHPLVRALARAGWRWGGELAGQQKDLMHFSPTGD